MNHYEIRNGQRIETVVLNPDIIPKKRRKPFKAHWVKFPLEWIEVLQRSKSKGAYQLALAILLEALKRQYCSGEIVLSTTVTRMSRATRMRAAKELVELGLIETEHKGKHAMRVSHIYYYHKN
jgi:hypothetical protein